MESNHRPAVYETAALPTELRRLPECGEMLGHRRGILLRPLQYCQCGIADDNHPLILHERHVFYSAACRHQASAGFRNNGLLLSASNSISAFTASPSTVR